MDTKAPIPATTPVKTAPPEDAVIPRIRLSMVTIFLGLFLFVIGTKPDWFGWDRSPVVGFVQIAVFLALMLD